MTQIAPGAATARKSARARPQRRISVRRARRTRSRRGAVAGPMSAGPSAEHDDLHGLHENQEVEKDGEVLDVVEVVLELLARILDRRAVSVANLGPARDAGLHGVPARVEGNLILEVGHE